MKQYSADIVWNASTERYVATCPELRDCVATGRTLQAAAKALENKIHSALSGWPEKQTVPTPRYSHYMNRRKAAARSYTVTQLTKGRRRT